jgi:hypothetical protein
MHEVIGDARVVTATYRPVRPQRGRRGMFQASECVRIIDPDRRQKIKAVVAQCNTECRDLLLVTLHIRFLHILGTLR